MGLARLLLVGTVAVFMAAAAGGCGPGARADDAGGDGAAGGDAGGGGGDAARDAPASPEAGPSSGCAQGVACMAAPVGADDTCAGAGGVLCGCAFDGTVNCASGYVRSGCPCNGPCLTEGAYCQNCGGSAARTCRCVSGLWNASHGAACP